MQDFLQQENGGPGSPAFPALPGWQQESFLAASEDRSVFALQGAVTTAQIRPKTFSHIQK
jgi:uncharacterized protein CbrC (UPF0167 family)